MSNGVCLCTSVRLSARLCFNGRSQACACVCACVRSFLRDIKDGSKRTHADSNSLLRSRVEVTHR